MIARIFSGLLVSAALAAGCSGNAESGSGSSGTSGASGTAPTGAGANGWCIGTAVEPRNMDDIDSCLLQGGKWDSVYKECNSTGVNLTDICKIKTTMDPGPAGDYGKGACIALLGCKWEAPDKSIVENLDLGGTCSGTPLPCKSQPKGLCTQVWGCEYKTSDMSCSTLQFGQPPCSDFSASTNAQTTGRHPESSRGKCLMRTGCTYTRTDGTATAAP